MIRGIVWDYGGVLELSPIELMAEVARLLGVSRPELGEVYFRYNHLANAHNMPWGEMFAQVVAEFDNSTETQSKVTALIKRANEEKVLNTPLIEYIRTLKTRGYKLGILSNYSDGLRQRLAQQGILDLFNTVVVSGEVGMQKPSAEIFHHTFGLLGIEVGEAIFVDDTKKSLETAPEIGYHPVYFQNTEDCIVAIETALMS